MRRPVVSKSERSGTGVDMANLSKAVCHGESDKCRFGNPPQEANFPRFGVRKQWPDLISYEKPSFGSTPRRADTWLRSRFVAGTATSRFRGNHPAREGAGWRGRQP